MTAQLPQGDSDFHLEIPSGVGTLDRPLSLYVHIPFCAVRCGYCDFNTYTADFGPGANVASYADTVIREAELVSSALQQAGSPRRVATVFFGGGTPTLLEGSEQGKILQQLRSLFDFAADAEVTTEANPESVDSAKLLLLKNAGFTRISFGMQSAVPHVLQTLDRTHRPQRVPVLVDYAKSIGLKTSVDLIYGTPGESLTDWDASVRAALLMDPGHISAYALTLEPGTKMFAQIQRGELPAIDPDFQALCYERAETLFTQAGYQWYEVSNWAKTDGDICRHNWAYWQGGDWWGLGPEAHSHLSGRRFWNVKSPRRYADMLAEGAFPVAGGEVVDAEGRKVEDVMLSLRTRQGVSVVGLPGADCLDQLVAEGLVEKEAAWARRAVLTLRGRLLADLVTRRLLAWE